MIGNRLKIARIASGLSLQEFSERLSLYSLHLTKAAISNYETGKTIPTASTLEILANTLTTSVDYFHKENWDDFNIELNNCPSIVNSKLFELMCYVQLELEKRIDIFDILNTKPLVAKITPTYIKKNDIEAVQSLANNIREQFGLGSGPISSVTTALEFNGFTILNMPINISTKNLSGIETSKNLPIILKVNALSIDDLRMSLLEQLGNFYITSDTKKDKDYLCNAFARYFLLPKSRLIQLIGLKRTEVQRREISNIKQSYGISTREITHSLFELGIIDQTVHNIFLRHIIHHDFARQTRYLPENLYFNEVPILFTNMLFRAYSEKLIDISTIFLYDPQFDQFVLKS